MRQASPLVLVMIIALPVCGARQSGQGQNPPDSSSSSSSSEKPSPTKPASHEEIATVDPSNAENDVEVAGYYMRKGDMNAAIPRLQEAVQLKPHYAKARLMLGEAYERTHDRDDALKTYQDYLKAFPNASDGKKIQKKIEKLSSER